MSDPNAAMATNVYVQMEMRKYQSTVKSISAGMARANTIADLARINSQLSTAAPAVLRGIARSMPDKRAAEAVARHRGMAIIEAEIKVLSLYKCTPEEQFIEHQGHFIRHVRDACRGNFPELYSKAENELQSLKIWRFRHLKHPQDYWPRAEPGDDLVQAEYAFTNVPLDGLGVVMRKGLKSGDFTSAPVERDGHAILAVRMSDLPNHVSVPIGQSNTGVPSHVLLQIDWSPVRKIEFDAANSIVQESSERTIEPEKIILSTGDGKAKPLVAELRIRGQLSAEYVQIISARVKTSHTRKAPNLKL